MLVTCSRLLRSCEKTRVVSLLSSLVHFRVTNAHYAVYNYRSPILFQQAQTERERERERVESADREESVPESENGHRHLSDSLNVELETRAADPLQQISPDMYPHGTPYLQYPNGPSPWLGLCGSCANTATVSSQHVEFTAWFTAA